MNQAMERLLELRGEAEERLLDQKLRMRMGITVGSATCEDAAGAPEVFERFRGLLEQHQVDDVVLSRVGCTGRCDMEPVVTVRSKGASPVKYIGVDPDKAAEIFASHIVEGMPVDKYAMPLSETAGAEYLEKSVWRNARLANRFHPVYGDADFFGRQLRVTLRNCAGIDPESLDEYLVVRGYEAAVKVLTEMTPQQVIDQVTKSGLRGRGGGGFPTGVKWNYAAIQKSDEKYIICNADEGDPGAFMDRSIIEGDPHTILEGMIIGGYAIGAHQGFVYIRAEYPLAIKRLENAIAAARKAGFLGRNIFGSDWDFDLEIRLGAGAFVCGEETALIHSIEGARGMPRPRPPYPAERACGASPP